MRDDFERDYGRYLAGEMAEAERLRFEDELLADPELAEEVYADLELANRRTPRRRSRARAVAWALPLAAVLATVLLWPRGPEPVPGNGPLRGGGGGIELLAPRAGGSQLGWRAVPAAESYLVELLDAEGRTLRTVTVADTTLALVPGDEPPAACRVVALDSLGTRLATSGLVVLPLED